jgi:hypothetical protein
MRPIFGNHNRTPLSIREGECPCMALDRARGTVLVVTLIVVLAAVTDVALAAEPTISVSVDDDDVAEGETVRTDSDPDIEIAESYEPGTESFSETVSLDLDNGKNDIRVVANADATATFDATILKDNASPFIEYTSPFETPGRRAPPDSIGVSDAEVTLSRDLIDDTGVESIAIEREFEVVYDPNVEPRIVVDIGGETTNRVDIDESLAVANGETQIRIIVSESSPEASVG